jgi:hypothetical protein
MVGRHIAKPLYVVGTRYPLVQTILVEESDNLGLSS